MTKVTTSDLRKCLDLVLRHLEEAGQKEFEFGEDFYWHIPTDDRYKSYESPKELSVGQLSEDWRHVKAVVDGADEPIGYCLVWLSSILRIIGEGSIA